MLQRLDDELMEKYLRDEGEDFTTEEIKAAIRKGYHRRTSSFPLPAVLLTETRAYRSFSTL